MSRALIDISKADIVATRQTSDGRFVIFTSTDVQPDWPLPWWGAVADTGGDGHGLLVGEASVIDVLKRVLGGSAKGITWWATHLKEVGLLPDDSPLCTAKAFDAPSVFRPENLLREARRQKNIPTGPVPEICVLDPDGDLVRHLIAAGRAHRSPVWACYHTDLYEFEAGGIRFGIVGCAVGASFAVLVAEQMFASGCELLLSVTSSGQIADAGPTPYFILISQALRDEGTSHHYLPPAAFAQAEPGLLRNAMSGLAGSGLRVIEGATWTTDAPYRETQAAIAAARARGVLAVEMEAAALYAFAIACAHPVLCFAHVTNQMAQIEGDFEKGEAGGAHDALELLVATVLAYRTAGSQRSADGP